MSWKDHLTPEETAALNDFNGIIKNARQEVQRIRKRGWSRLLKERDLADRRAG